MLLLSCFYFYSCGTTQSTGSSQGDISHHQPPAAPAEIKKEPIVPPTEKKLPGKNEYTIAMLLPFQGSKVFITDLNESSEYYFPEESQLAAEYYQGAMIALDTLKKMGLKAKMVVYDVGMDTTQLKKRLLEPDLKSADLIIGPVGNSSLKITCEFSMKNKIWLVSPFSVTAIGNNPNPYYLLANATMRTHCEKIYDYISKNKPAGKVILLYRKRPAELELVKYFKDYQLLQESISGNSLRFIELTDSSEKKIGQVKEFLFDDHRNLIIIPSNDALFVRNVIKQLNGITDGFLMDVFGMPTWINFDLIPQEQLANTSTHITQNFWLDKTSVTATHFKDMYVREFNMNPSDYAVKGYDQVMYFGSLLLKNGTDLEDSFKKNGTSELAERFSLEPVPVPGNTKGVWYYENKSVYMLRYEEDTLKRIPD
ncbi:MAG: hypothetical protein ABIO46_03160 [Chitinophagales bacterium]